MSMVFCRGCGKEIHETAPTCPNCGAVQRIPASSVPTQRNVGMLIIFSIVWTIAFWFLSLFVTGAIAGAMNPHDASNAGARAGEAVSGWFFLIAMCLSVGLTIAGVLPGTRKTSN